ncbi:MAG: hypothetical protein K8I02_05750, partial [Candidatus Methylomirabilis sp.]|nr:hypothetical protein [Deltaproteobacteria bacterium]
MSDPKKLVIYHAQCADGFGAAWAAWKVLGDDAEYVAAKYGDPPPEVAGRDVSIVDFSYPRATLLEMKKAAASLEVLDHHKTAEEDLRGLPFAKFDLAKSGAMLAWERWHPEEPPPDLIRYIQDKDLWTWKLPESEEVAVALASYPYDFAAWDRLTAERLRDEGGAILRFQNQLVDEVLHVVRRERIAGYDVPVVNCPVLQSYVGNRLAAG